MVGKSGSMSERLAVVTARPLSRPDLTCGIAVDGDANTSCTSPDRSAVIAGDPPLYGTWTILVLVMLSMSSPARWPALPAPLEPYERPPGLDRSIAMSS